MAQERSSTRKEIIRMLKMQGSLTVSEMAVKLNITEMAVRRHLQTLERERLVQSKTIRQAMGRPTHTYSLTEQADPLFPANYADFSVELLKDLQAIGGDEQINQLFTLREDRMADIYSKQLSGKSMEEKVAQLAYLQHQRGYMVDYEQDEKNGNWILKEFNCPIAKVAKSFQQACACELSLFERVLEAEVELQECIAKGEEKCKYVIKPNIKAT
jgi:iron-sulfur cluster biosynthesis transcriptional regulator SufR